MKEGRIFKQEFNEVTHLKDWRRRHVTLGPKSLSVTVNSAKGARSRNDEHHSLEYVNIISALPCRECSACRRLQVCLTRILQPIFSRPLLPARPPPSLPLFLMLSLGLRASLLSMHACLRACKHSLALQLIYVMHIYTTMSDINLPGARDNRRVQIVCLSHWNTLFAGLTRRCIRLHVCSACCVVPKKHVPVRA